MNKLEVIKKFKQDMIALCNNDNKMLATYLATYITEEYEEADLEDIEPLSEILFQGLEAFEGGAR
tara:strand:+ start:137 stop:331 length:195 start_codon:yes stop_codon:yes gene_type:complete